MVDTAVIDAAGPASALNFTQGGGVPSAAQFATPIPQDRLVRKEVSLGAIREIIPPTEHIGLKLIAPFMEVATDDVVFQYILGASDGLAPARAQDAESELSQYDDLFGTEGRASVMDWAIKDHYSTSDVSSYREWLMIQQQLRDTQNFPLTVASAIDGFETKLARDAQRRMRKLNNRLETLIVGALQTGAIAYNDGRVKFNVDFGRPATQNVAPGSTLPALNQASAFTLNSSGWLKNDGTGDPINDIVGIQNWFYDAYGVRMGRAIASRKILTGLAKSAKFTTRTGLVVGGSPVSSPIDPNYLIDGWGPNAAQDIIQQATGVQFIEYDSIYRTRTPGSTSTTNVRFLPQNMVIFLPSEEDIAQFDDTGIGFAKTLTSPHPAGGWTSGFYEWERDCGVDPWGYDAGTGIKAFPVFLHMECTASYTLDVTGAA